MNQIHQKMKKISSLFAILCLIASVSFAQTEDKSEAAPAAPGPKMEFETVKNYMD